MALSNQLDWKSRDGFLFKNGERFFLKGLSWFGFETDLRIFHGLKLHDYRFYFDFMKKNKFNALRIPISLDLLLNDGKPKGVSFEKNKELQKKTSLEVLDLFVQTAEEFEFFILFDLHSFEANSFKQNGLWYDEEHPETTVLQGWDVLIQRYSNAKSVFAVDLKNEPFSATWGTENLQTDWNRAAERIGSYIVERTNWLIFIEGTGATPRCAEPCFWGENLQGVETTPVRLSQPNRLVYSPHCYGPDVHNQNYFSHDNFPQNMPRIWDRHFGFIRGKNESAVVVGEWGGSTDGKNGVWFREFADYLIKKDMTDTFFWCLNPNSYDTGGLLEKDWTTPVQSKLDILSTLVPLPS